MALNDIYKLTLSGQTLGEDNDNVFYYRTEATGSGSGAQNLCNSFEATILPAIFPLLSENATFQLIEAVNLASPTDYYSQVPSPNAGTRDSDGGVNDMPSFLVASVQFNRNGPGTRYSYKRFSGLLKADTLGNDLQSGTAAAWVSACVVFAVAAVFGSWTFRPVQVKHPTPLGVNPVVNFVIGQVLEVELGTQNTRKD